MGSGDVDGGVLRHLQPDRVEDAFFLVQPGVCPRGVRGGGKRACELHIMVHAQPQPHTSGSHDRGAAYALARPEGLLIDGDNPSSGGIRIEPYRNIKCQIQRIDPNGAVAIVQRH